MSKYIKVLDGFAINRKTAWIGHIQEEPACEKTEGFLWLRVTIKENTKYFFDFGDDKQDFRTTCDTGEEALKEWERVFSLINEKSK
jgi:hypothetical protein